MHKMRPYMKTALTLGKITYWGDWIALFIAPMYGVCIRYAYPIARVLVPFLPDLDAIKQPLDSILLLLAAYGVMYPAVLSGVEERTNGIALSLTITPLKTGGYFGCRYLPPMVLSFVYALLMELCFATVERTLVHALVLSALSVSTAFGGMLLAPLLSDDKHGGIVFLKIGLWTLIVLVPIVGYLLPAPAQPLFLLFPFYWFMRYGAVRDWLLALLCALTAFIWIGSGYGLWKRSLCRMKYSGGLEA